MSAGRLVGKAAIVTGGGSGIGRAICQVFAREGASVAVLDVNVNGIGETLSAMPSNHGNRHCSIEADVCSPEQAKQSVLMAENKLGQQTNILVNNAGILREGYLTQLTEKMFDDVIRVNLKGVFLMSKEFILALKTPTGWLPASVINISSISGKAGFSKASNYSASKFGVIGMTKSIALEYGKFDIRCNAVLPGLIKTPMANGASIESVELIQSQIPMKRLGRPEEVANVCLFLASDESSYVNGASLEVTGGLAA